jgi:hypothetical protein
MRRLLVVAIGSVAISLSVACDNSGGSSAVTAPTAPSTTETFTGTVNPQGSDSHTFTVTATGELDVTLTAAGPPSTISVGLGLGTPSTTDPTVCSLLSNAALSTQAATTPQLVGTAAPGSYCVAVFDVGNQSAAVTYTVTVTHT